MRDNRLCGSNSICGAGRTRTADLSLMRATSYRCSTALCLKTNRADKCTLASIGSAALWLTIFFTCQGCTSVCLSVSLYRIFYNKKLLCLGLLYLRIFREVSVCGLTHYIVDNICFLSYRLVGLSIYCHLNPPAWCITPLAARLMPVRPIPV